MCVTFCRVCETSVPSLPISFVSSHGVWPIVRAIASIRLPSTRVSGGIGQLEINRRNRFGECSDDGRRELGQEQSKQTQRLSFAWDIVGRASPYLCCGAKRQLLSSTLVSCRVVWCAYEIKSRGIYFAVREKRNSFWFDYVN